MTLATISELKSEIVEDLARSDVTGASAVLDRFIIQCEKYINKRLRVLEMTKQSVLTINAVEIDLPDDFIDVKNIELSDSPRALTSESENFISRTYASTNAGRPKVYTILYSNSAENHRIKFGPIPSGTYTANLNYYAELPSLTEETENVILLEYPDLYLNGCLYYAFKKYRNFDIADQYKSLLDQDIGTLNANKQNSLLAPGSRVRYVGTIV